MWWELLGEGGTGSPGSPPRCVKGSKADVGCGVQGERSESVASRSEPSALWTRQPGRGDQQRSPEIPMHGWG